MKIHQSMWIQWPVFKNLCPGPMGIHQCTGCPRMINSRQKDFSTYLFFSNTVQIILGHPVCGYGDQFAKLNQDTTYYLWAEHTNIHMYTTYKKWLLCFFWTKFRLDKMWLGYQVPFSFCLKLKVRLQMQKKQLHLCKFYWSDCVVEISRNTSIPKKKKKYPWTQIYWIDNRQ